MQATREGQARRQKVKKIVTMKNLIILVSAIMMAATANAQRVNTEKFHEVYVNIPAVVRIVKSDTCSVNVISSNQELAKSVRKKVRNGVLELNMRDADKATSPILVVITAPDMPRLTTGSDMQALVVKKRSAARDLAVNE